MNSCQTNTSLVSALSALGLFPRDIVVYLTSRCNLRCRHCYVGNELLDATVGWEGNYVLEVLSALQPLDRVTLLGGEPFLHPSISTIVGELGRMQVAERRITTNLTLLSDEALDSVIQNGFRLCVSLDGHCSSLHDNIRGRGAFSRTVMNLRRAVSEDADLEVTHSLHRGNVAFFPDFVRFCKDHGIRRVNLHRVSGQGNARSNPELILTPSEWRDFVRTLRDYEAAPPALTLRYPLLFATRAEFDALVKSEHYHHHFQRSFYSSSGHRIVLYPDGKVFISSEGFGTDAQIGTVVDGIFQFNSSPSNELTLGLRGQFDVAELNPDLRGDETFQIALSFSFRRSVDL